MQDTQEVFEAGDDSRKVSKQVICFALMQDLLYAEFWLDESASLLNFGQINIRQKSDIKVQFT